LVSYFYSFLLFHTINFIINWLQCQILIWNTKTKGILCNDVYNSREQWKSNGPTHIYTQPWSWRLYLAYMVDAMTKKKNRSYVLLGIIWDLLFENDNILNCLISCFSSNTKPSQHLKLNQWHKQCQCFFLHKPPLYMYKKSPKNFCTEIFFCTFKKGVFWHVKHLKISV